MINQNDLKKKAALAALKYVGQNSIIGVGTGSTTNYFIDALATLKDQIEGAVASSIETEKRLRAHGINVIELNSVSTISVYIDGADEANETGYLIKGGGGAMTREKIVASASQQFVCIIDKSKKVPFLGANMPIPIEVIPMARSFVGRELVKLGSNPIYRENTVTDNGNIIIDAYGLPINEPLKLESVLNNLPGVVGNGLFARRRANILLIGTEEGVETHQCF